MKKIFSLLAVVLFAGSMMADNFAVVSSVSDLANGDQIIITGIDTAYAISTTQNPNNRGVAAVSATDGVVVPGADVQIITLVADGGNFMLQVGEDAYLYAASNSSNYLKTADAATVGDNGKFAITMDANGIASITAQGANQRNDLRYNPSNSIFSCYASSSSIEAGLRILKKQGGAAPSVATPVISGDATFTESVIVTITCSTPETDIYYTTDGTTDPKCDCAAAPEYTHEIVLTETTTIMAAAYTGSDWSAVATKTFTKKEPLVAISCAAVYGLADNAELALNPVVVTYSNGANVWVKDETGSMLVYLPQNFNNEYVAGDILEGLQGTKATYKGLVEVKPTLDQMSAVTATHGEAPAPEELAVVSNADVNKYILIKGVSAEGVFAEGTASNINITLGNAAYVLRNNFKNGYTFEAGKAYDVVALVSYYNALQLYFVSAEEAEAPVVEAIVYNWAKDAANQVGTTILAEAGVAVSTVKIHTNTDAVDALELSKSIKVDSFYVAIKPAEGKFLAGDVLTIAGCINNGAANKYGMIDVYADGFTNRIFRTDTVIDGKIVNDEPKVQTYTLEADADSLLLGRYGNTKTYITLLTVSRAAEEPVVPQPEEPVVADTLTVAEAVALGMALDSAATSEAIYAVEGYVINAAAFSQLYRNQTWEMADAADATASGFKAYNCYPIEGADTLKVLNGDKVLLIGHLKKYKGKNDTVYTIEIEKGNAEFISKVEGDHSIAVETEAITVAQALEIGAALADNGVTEKMYKITGYVSAEDPKGAYSDQYGNQSFWVADEAGSTAATNAEGAFYVYRGKPDTKAAITVGSKVEFTCTIKKFVKDATTGPVIENADQNIVIKVLEAGVVELDTLNVTQAVAAALALEDNAESAKPVAVIGNVAKIATAYSDQFHNISFFMTDDAVSAEAYGDLKVYQGNIDEAAGKALAPGDRVMVVGKLYNNFYNNANSAQIAKGSEVTVMWKQALEQIVLTEKVNKVIMDGVIYIVRDGKLYNLQGAQVR